MPASIFVIDDFNRANANPIGGDWTTVTGLTSMQLKTNTLRGSVLGTTCAAYHSFTLANDQFAQIQTIAIGEGSVQKAIARQQAGADSQYKGEWVGLIGPKYGASATVRITKSVAGSATNISTGTTTTATLDIFRIGVVGSTLTLYQNGVPILTGTDTSFSSGKGGAAVFPNGASVDDDIMDNYGAGEFRELTDFSDFPKPKIRDAVRAGWLA